MSGISKGYNGYSDDIKKEMEEPGWVSVSPDMTEVYANDRRLQQLLKRQSQYEKNSKKWHAVESKINFRKELLEGLGSSTNPKEKVNKNQVAEGYFDVSNGKTYINGKEVTFDEYRKFKGMTDYDKLLNYGENRDKVILKGENKVSDVLVDGSQLEESKELISKGEKELIDESLGRKTVNEEVENFLDDRNQTRNQVSQGETTISEFGSNISVDPPPEEDKSKASFVPPITIQHPEDGMFQIGRERDTDVNRKKDIAIKGSKSQGLRLFHDGGFELTTSEDARAAEKGSTIQSVVDGGTLVIKSLGDILIECDGRFSVVANDIRMETMNAMEGDITLTAKHNMTLQSDNYTFIQSESLTLHGTERFIANSNGWMMLIGQNVRIHEPKTKLCPLPLEDYIKQQTKLFK